LTANHFYSVMQLTLCFYRGFFFISHRIYSLYLTFFIGTGDGITLKVYSSYRQTMDALRVNCAY
ncbi:hypothetical protein ACNHGO_004957, partial [Salmonella enterica subsp. enterica serovar Newport]